MAENERLKGNEFMKANECAEAVKCYTKSIDYNASEPATYSNRAMAHLKLKDFSKAIDDSNSALALKPDYLKAFHRRGKAYASVNKLDLAIKDF
jgi:tetratricopeptide (TPR) repeat protein